MGVVSIPQFSSAGTRQNRLFVPFNDWLVIQVAAYRLCDKLNQMTVMTNKQGDAITHHAIFQSERRLIQNDDIHLIRVERRHQAADQVKPTIKIAGRIGRTLKQHGHVDIRQWAGRSAGARAIQDGQTDISARSENVYGCRLIG
jgi:hypothetical protein